MRFTHKDTPRGFRIPFGIWVIPPLGAVLCVLLMVTSSKETGIRLAVWMAIGQVIYFAYGFWHSKLRLSKQAVSAVALDNLAKHQESSSIPNEYNSEMTVFNDQKL
jgi:basic amino acid/polyamine antiporter, APA family